MKTYREMVMWIVDSSLYQGEWSARRTIAEAYGVSPETVLNDVKFEKDLREKALKEKRKAEHRASNEQRRLANLAAKEKQDLRKTN